MAGSCDVSKKIDTLLHVVTVVFAYCILTHIHGQVSVEANFRRHS